MIAATRYYILLLAFLLVTPSRADSSTVEGGRVGGGGGAVVCRSPMTGQVEYAKFYDLFENSTYGIRDELRTTHNQPAEEALDAVLPLRLEFPALYRAAVRSLSAFRWKVYPKIAEARARFEKNPNFVSAPLTTVHDLGKPLVLPEYCPGDQGLTPRYENIALFYSANIFERGFELDFNYEIYRKLPTVEQAALRVHEILYLLYRFQTLDFTSLRIRPLTAALFSGAGMEKIRSLALTAFGAYEPFRQGNPLLDAWIKKDSWKLSSRDANAELSEIFTSRSEEASFWKEKVLPLRDAVRAGNGPKIDSLLKSSNRFHSVNYAADLDADVNIPMKNDLWEFTGKKRGWFFDGSRIPSAFRHSLRSEEWLPLPVYAILLSDAAYDSVASLITQRSFSPSAATPNGLTALHAAVLKGEPRYVSALLEQYSTRLDGVWKTRSQDGSTRDWTPIELARHLGHAKIVKLLEGAVAPVALFEEEE